MPRAGVDAEKIVDTAMAITESSGIEAVTLKEIGQRLHVSSSSLYNHVKNLTEIKTKVMHRALKMLKEDMFKAALGKSGTDIIRGIGEAYIHFAQEHSHLYETLQWVNVWEEPEERTIFSDLMQFAWKASAEMGLTELESNHIIRTVRGLVHGFASVEGHHGFGHAASVQDSFEYALDTFIMGVKYRQLTESQKNPDVN